MEAPPAKNLLVIVTLLSTFAILVSIMPAGFVLGSNPDYRKVDVPSYFEAIDISTYADTYVFNITDDVFYKEWGKTEFGHDMFFRAYRPPTWYEYWFANWHCHPFLFFYGWGAHKMEWINQNGISRGYTIHDTDISQDMTNGTAQYTVKCSHFEMMAWIGYDTAVYSSLTDAWDNDELCFMFAIDWDEKGTGMNAWNLISMLLFFQLPNIHWTINALIAIPMWLMIGYCIFAFVMAVIKSLPFT